MIPPVKPHDEKSRQAALEATELLDTGEEERFDRYTRLVKRLFDVPIALVSLVDSDRQWFKSKQGLDATETSREVSFCGHAILKDDVFVVEDATDDVRFGDNPLVTNDPNIRFYAGCPLSSIDGFRIGTLCIIDSEPRQLQNSDIETLKDMAAMVAGEIAALRLATVDELTGLSNRRAFNMIASQALLMCERNQQPASLAMIDLNGFKQINDSLGHQVGDAALREFSSLMLNVFRESDLCARLGGDEFGVLMVGADNTRVEAALKRLEQAVAECNRKPGRQYQLDYSIGVVPFDPVNHQTITALLDQADQLMYEEKRLQKELLCEIA